MTRGVWEREADAKNGANAVGMCMPTGGRIEGREATQQRGPDWTDLLSAFLVTARSISLGTSRRISITFFFITLRIRPGGMCQR